MTTEHNRRASDLLAAEVSKRGFIIERQEKHIASLEKLLFEAAGALIAYHGVIPSETTWEIIEKINKIGNILPPATPKGE